MNECTNNDRADWAEIAVQKFQEVTGTDDDSAMLDLFCNLMHLADRRGIDCDREVERGRDHYSCEIDPDDDISPGVKLDGRKDIKRDGWITELVGLCGEDIFTDAHEYRRRTQRACDLAFAIQMGREPDPMPPEDPE